MYRNAGLQNGPFGYPWTGLGSTIGNAAFEHHKNTGLPLENIGTFALGVACGISQDIVDVVGPDGKPEPTSENVLVLEESVRGKDKALGPFLAVLRDFQNAQVDLASMSGSRNAVNHRIWQIQKGVLEARYRQMLTNGMTPTLESPDGRSSVFEDPGELRALKLHLSIEPKPVHSSVVLHDSYTRVGLRKSLLRGHRSAVILDSEAKNAIRRMRTEAVDVNNTWDGKDIADTSAKDTYQRVAAPRVSRILATQPAPFHEIMRTIGQELSEQGTLARMLVSWRQSEFDMHSSMHPTTDFIQRFYEVGLALLYESVEMSRGGHAPRRQVRLSVNVQNAEKEKRAHYEAVAASLPPDSIARPSLRRALQHARRAVSASHAFDCLTGDISIEAYCKVAPLIDWYMDRALEIFVHPSQQKAAMVESALFAAWNFGVKAVPMNQLKLYCNGTYRKQSDIEEGVRVLISWGRAALDGRSALYSRMIPQPPKPLGKSAI
ncbi:MAG: DUF3987 domain-containing protein [Pseudomonadota bacterium]